MTRTYSISHITDLADIADEDVDEFVKTLPNLINALKVTKACQINGLPLSTILPAIRFQPDLKEDVVFNSEDTSLPCTGESLEIAKNRLRP